MTKSPNKSPRQTKIEKQSKIVDYLNSILESGGGKVTIDDICRECELPKNGHTVDCILAVTDTAKSQVYIHHVSIGIGTTTRYEIEVLPHK